MAIKESSLRLSLQDTLWLEFRSRDIQHLYDSYRVADVSPRVLLLVVLIITILHAVFLVNSTQSRYGYLLLYIRAAKLTLLLPSWLLIRRLYITRSSLIESSVHLANVSIFCLTTSLCFENVMRTLIGTCQAEEATINCIPQNSLPQNIIIGLLINVLCCQAVFKCYRSRVLAACWSMTMATLIFCIAWAKAIESIPLLFVYTILGMILYEYEKKGLYAYIALQNMEHSIRTHMHAENEKRLIEMRSVEMRHLLGNVAHDLKTPMQSFVMDLELMSKMIKRPASQSAEFISYLARDVQQMVSSLQNLTDTNSFMYMVINRAIDFAKSSSDRSLTPNLATINFVESIQWAVNMVKSKTSLVPVTLEPVPAYISPHIITDKQWLIENVLCLISNAVKFTMAGSVTVRCELIHTSKNALDVVIEEDIDDDDTSLSSGDELLIEVEDTGIGIPEEKRESMFQPFQQTMRMAGGTGLGLYSLRNRVDALKGSCGISDRRDGADGARIWFKIPYRCDYNETFNAVVETKEDSPLFFGFSFSEVVASTPRDDTSIETTSGFEPTPRKSSQGSTDSYAILLVDDSLTIRKSISRVLMNEGLSVDLAENGLMALEMMGSKRYDLVLMDLQMPVMDGLEAVRRLRKQESESGDEYHQKVIGISAYTGEPYCSDAINAGMDGFIEKPFSAKRFMEMMRTLQKS